MSTERGLREYEDRTAYAYPQSRAEQSRKERKQDDEREELKKKRIEVEGRPPE